MNLGLIIYVLGSGLKIIGGLMIFPCLTAIIYHESAGWYFVGWGLASLAAGYLITLKKPRNQVYYLKEGCVITGLSWVVLSMVGAGPMCMTGAIPAYIDAVFEMISGFTTTGSSILTDVEVLPRCCLFWRSFSHWIGGMGILVFMLAVLPLTSGSRMNLMKAESPGPTVGKLVPKVRETAKLLYAMYFVITMIEFVLLLLGRMPVFDAMCITFGTAGTGGFGVRNSSVGGYSPYVQWIVGIFMLLFGVNFNAYFLIYRKRIKEALRMEELRWYFAMAFGAFMLIFLNMYHTAESGLTLAREVFFQVSSLITSTGFSTADFDLWPDFSKTVLIFIMFTGACAGSTGGGIKVQRFVILVKNAMREMKYYLHPRSVHTIKSDGKTVDEATVSSINVYLATFLGIFVTSIFLVSLEGRDLITNFTAVLTTFNNMGPGFAAVGPTKNFADFTVLSKLVLMFDMLAGRLELYPMLMLFNPVLWKESLDARRGHR